MPNPQGLIERRLAFLEKICEEDRKRWEKSDERWRRNDDRIRRMLLVIQDQSKKFNQKFQRQEARTDATLKILHRLLEGR